MLTKQHIKNINFLVSFYTFIKSYNINNYFSKINIPNKNLLLFYSNYSHTYNSKYFSSLNSNFVILTVVNTKDTYDFKIYIFNNKKLIQYVNFKTKVHVIYNEGLGYIRIFYNYIGGNKNKYKYINNKNYIELNINNNRITVLKSKRNKKIYITTPYWFEYYYYMYNYNIYIKQLKIINYNKYLLFKYLDLYKVIFYVYKINYIIN